MRVERMLISALCTGADPTIPLNYFWRFHSSIRKCGIFNDVKIQSGFEEGSAPKCFTSYAFMPLDSESYKHFQTLYK